MRTTWMLIDGMNIGHAAQSTNKLMIGSTEVQAIYGFLRILRSLIERYPTARPVVLWDGASWRKSVFADYKANREKADTKAEIEKQREKDAFKAQRKHIETAVRLLGIPQLKAHNYEADDLAGILVERAEKKGDAVLLISGDRDWVQLVGPSVTWWDPVRDVKIMPRDLLEKFGVDTPEKFLEFKALMGDAGDNLPPAGGIGEKTAPKLLMEFKSIQNLLNLMLEGSLPKQDWRVEKFLKDNEAHSRFERNLALMRLRSGSHRPAPVQLKMTREEPNLPAFKTFCERLMFRSFLKAFDQWTQPFVRASASHGAIA